MWLTRLSKGETASQLHISYRAAHWSYDRLYGLKARHTASGSRLRNTVHSWLERIYPAKPCRDAETSAVQSAVCMEQGEING